MDKILDEKTLYAAAVWWTRLRDPSEDTKAVEQWLEWSQADERNLEAFERVTELGNRLGTLDDLTRRRWAGEFARQPARPRSRFPLAAAAGTVLVVFSGYLAWNHLETRVTSQDYLSTVAQNRDITLSDGSTVALGGASSLTTHFSKNERHVELGAGEAFFQVVHNTQRPFVVTAGNVSIRDVGTAFDVRRTGQYVTIAVTQGRVHIADSGGASGSSTAGTGSLEAVAGQQVSYDPGTAALSVVSIAPGQGTAWRSDRLEFIDAPLGVVVANVNRYSARTVHIADADLETLTFTGTIRTGAIDSWLSALPQVFPLRISEDAHQVTLSNAERKQNR
jgi:transmembrane sensor